MEDVEVDAAIAVDKLIDSLGLANIEQTDPVYIAAEAVIYARQPIVIAQQAAKALPANSTDFERGMAYGMALILSR